MGLFFEGANWKSSDIHALQVVTSLFNSIRAKKNILNKHHYADQAAAVNFHFTDSGLFGLRISGASSNSNDLLKVMVDEFKGLAGKIDTAELESAKQYLTTQVLLTMDR